MEEVGDRNSMFSPQNQGLSSSQYINVFSNLEAPPGLDVQEF